MSEKDHRKKKKIASLLYDYFYHDWETPGQYLYIVNACKTSITNVALNTINEHVIPAIM